MLFSKWIVADISVSCYEQVKKGGTRFYNCKTAPLKDYVLVIFFLKTSKTNRTILHNLLMALTLYDCLIPSTLDPSSLIFVDPKTTHSSKNTAQFIFRIQNGQNAQKSRTWNGQSDPSTSFLNFAFPTAGPAVWLGSWSPKINWSRSKGLIGEQKNITKIYEILRCSKFWILLNLSKFNLFCSFVDVICVFTQAVGCFFLRVGCGGACPLRSR